MTQNRDLTARNDLPSGTVTFLFTDVEGSTKLLDALGAERYADALAEHRLLLRAAFTRHGGVEVDTQGDAFFVAFATAQAAARGRQPRAGAQRHPQPGSKVATVWEGPANVSFRPAAWVAAQPAPPVDTA